MKQIYSNQGPRFTTDVSENEKAVAKAVKKDFKDLLHELNDALDIIYDFKNAVVEERPSKDDLSNRYKGRLLRLKRKIIKAFNQLLEKLKKIIESLMKIMDPEMVSLRALIMAEFDELSDGVEGVLNLLDNADNNGFTKELERLCTQLQNRKTSVDGIIDNQMMSHLESDILGKMKISNLKINIIKRTRLIQKIAMER